MLQREAKRTGIPYQVLLDRFREGEALDGHAVAAPDLAAQLKRIEERLDRLEYFILPEGTVEAERAARVVTAPAEERAPSVVEAGPPPTVAPAPPVPAEVPAAVPRVEPSAPSPKVTAPVVPKAPPPRVPQAPQAPPAPAPQPYVPRPVPARQPLDLEELVSGRGLAWVGGLALLIGAVFFLSLAFSRGWIGPAGRVTIGMLAGLALFAGGAWSFERRERVFGHVLTAVGLGVISMSFMAATRLYDLIPIGLGLFGTLLVVGCAAAIAIRANSQVVAAYGLVAALVAPPLLGARADGGTVAFLSIVLAGTTAIALYHSWRWLPGLAFFLSLPQVLDFVLSEGPAGGRLAAAFGFWLLNAIAAGGEEFRVRTNRLRITSATLLMVNAAVFVAGGFAVLNGALEGWRGLFMLVVALGHAAIGGYFLRDEGDRHPFGMLAFGTGAAALTMAVPIQLGGPWVPLAWASEAAALAWIYSRLRNPFAGGASVVLGSMALGHLLAFEYPVADVAKDLERTWPFLNANGGTLAFLLLALAAAGWFLRSRLVRALLAAIGVLLVAYALPFELSGVALVACWSALFVGAVVAGRLLLPRGVILFGHGPFDLSWNIERALAMAGGVAGGLAFLHALAFELTPDEMNLASPGIPFTDERTVVALILSAAVVLAGLAAGGSPARQAGVALAGATLAWLLPFELEPPALALGWAVLALALFGLIRLLPDDRLAYLGVGLGLGAFAFGHAMFVDLPGDEIGVRYPDIPFVDAYTLVAGGLALAAVLGGLLIGGGYWRRSGVVLAVATLAWLLPFELRYVAMVIGWAVILVILLGLTRLLPDDRFAYLTAAAGLGAIGYICALVLIVPASEAGAPYPDVPFIDGKTLVAVVLAGCAVLTGLATGGRYAALARQAGVVLAAATLAWLLPFELHPAALVVGWSAIGLALLLLTRRLPEDVLTYVLAALVLLGLGMLVGVIRVAPPERLAVDIGSTVDHPLFWSGATAALGAVAAVAAFGAWDLRRVSRLFTLPLALAAAVLTVYLLSVGVVDVFQGRVGEGRALEELKKQAQVALSILWAVLGGGAFVFGVLRRRHEARIFGLALLALTTGKVFLYDLASLDAAYRVLSFVGLGILLLASSWFYQRLMPREDERRGPGTPEPT